MVIMGINYYWRYNICEHCDRYDNIHIGKSSHGWTFSFHGMVRKPWDDESILNIVSYKDWLHFFKKETGKIYNEYGDWVSVKQFKYIVESKRNAKLNHTIYCRKSEECSTREHGFKTCFLDDDGNSFNTCEFS